ncbi:MAG: phospholipase A [Guyparkeria sp.]
MQPARPPHSALPALTLALGGSLLVAPITTATASSWADCARIEADSERLACFDAMAADESAEAPQPAGQPEKADATVAGKEGGEATAGSSPVASSDEAKEEGWQSLLPALADSDPVALEKRLQSEQRDEHNPFVMRSYKPNYMMPATYTPTDLSRDVYDFEPQHAETKFQLSFQFDWFKEPLGPGTSLYFGYTQLSLWQTYNTEWLGQEVDYSSPFRETNYEPEAGLTVDMDYSLAGLTFRRARLSFIHASNGQGGDRSRSWNRLAAGVAFGRGNFAGQLRGWYRLPEPDKDENPHITDYMGHGDLLLAYKWREQTLALTLRNNLDFSENKGAVQLDYSFPLNNRVKGYVQYFNGYGESLIDYNRSVSRIGVGIALTDWL